MIWTSETRPMADVIWRWARQNVRKSGLALSTQSLNRRHSLYVEQLRNQETRWKALLALHEALHAILSSQLFFPLLCHQRTTGFPQRVAPHTDWTLILTGIPSCERALPCSTCVGHRHQHPGTMSTTQRRSAWGGYRRGERCQSWLAERVQFLGGHRIARPRPPQTWVHKAQPTTSLVAWIQCRWNCRRICVNPRSRRAGKWKDPTSMNSGA